MASTAPSRRPALHRPTVVKHLADHWSKCHLVADDRGALIWQQDVAHGGVVLRREHIVDIRGADDKPISFDLRHLHVTTFADVDHVWLHGERVRATMPSKLVGGLVKKMEKSGFGFASPDYGRRCVLVALVGTDAIHQSAVLGTLYLQTFDKPLTGPMAPFNAPHILVTALEIVAGLRRHRLARGFVHTALHALTCNRPAALGAPDRHDMMHHLLVAQVDGNRGDDAKELVDGFTQSGFELQPSGAVNAPMRLLIRKPDDAVR